MPLPKHTIGVDLGGTNMQIGLVGGTGEDSKVLTRAKRKTRPDEGEQAVVVRLMEGIREACELAKISPRDLAGVGIGAPGVIDPATGTVVEAVNLCWRDVPLAKMVKDEFKVPVVVDNDVNVAIYGENRLGAGENAQNLLGVWLGTGVGGGLILNGQIHYGDFNSGGEIGHITLFPRAAVGARSFEQNCSRTALVERLVRLIQSNHPSALTELSGGDLGAVKSKTVAKAYQMGDPLTVEVVDDAAELVGIAIAGIVTVLSLGRVVLGGGLTEALGDPLVERVRKSVRANVFPDKARAVKVVATELLDDAGVLGAAMLAQEAVARKG
jgi:glucokinase